MNNFQKMQKDLVNLKMMNYSNNLNLIIKKENLSKIKFKQKN